MKSEYHFKFSAPLHDLDTEEQTYGCRATTPAACPRCDLEKVCAFVREDHICQSPSKAWPKQFKKLRSMPADPANA